MKFGDVIIATASLALITRSLYAVLAVASLPLKSDLLAYIIASLVSSLIVGYVFSPKIQEESKIKAIGGIVVLSTFVLMVFLVIWFASPQASPMFKDYLSSMFNTSGWTNIEWAVYSAAVQMLFTVIGLVVLFIGLYAGSMLRRPAEKGK